MHGITMANRSYGERFSLRLVKVARKISGLISNPTTLKHFLRIHPQPRRRNTDVSSHCGVVQLHLI